MKALTLRPHWAWLVVSGHKDIENRSWPTRLRGRIWIHASSRRVTRAEYDEFVDTCHERCIKSFPAQENFRVGGLVGSVEIVDCVTDSPSYWFSGKYGFVLRNAGKMTFRPMKGMLGFFEVRSRRSGTTCRVLPKTGDYVAYHGTELMGYKYTPVPGKFRFFSRKPRAYLEKAIGADVWVITGTRDRQRKVAYRLAAVYTPNELKHAGEDYQIRGKHGHIFKPTVELNCFPWFARLLREQSGFSFGFNRIQNLAFVRALRNLRNRANG